VPVLQAMMLTHLRLLVRTHCTALHTNHFHLYHVHAGLLLQESEPEELHAAQLGSASDLALLEAYALAHSDAEPQLLADVRAATAEAFPQARHMVSGPLQGRLLKALAALKGAKRVLEVSAAATAAVLSCIAIVVGTAGCVYVAVCALVALLQCGFQTTTRHST
jgi:hypothetical protein